MRRTSRSSSELIGYLDSERFTFFSRILVRILESSPDALVLCVAAHDVGEYVRHYPRGKKYVLLHLRVCSVDSCNCLQYPRAKSWQTGGHEVAHCRRSERTLSRSACSPKVDGKWLIIKNSSIIHVLKGVKLGVPGQTICGLGRSDF